MKDQAAIKMENVTVSYGTRPAILGITLSIPNGSVVGIIGPNGAGKTTLIKAVMGLVPMDRGKVTMLGKPLNEVRKLITYVPQKSQIDWDYPVVVKEVVVMGRYCHLGLIHRPKKSDWEIVDRSLERLGMSEFVDRQIGELSGGQQQRVFLARALAQEAQILLLDEPFVGVDAATEKTIFNLMIEMKNEGKTVLVVNHDLSNVTKYYDHLLLLNQRVVAYGPVAEVFTPDLLNKTYGGRLTIFESTGRNSTVVQG